MNKLFFVVGILSNFFGYLDACVYMTVSPAPPDVLMVNCYCVEKILSLKVYDQDPEKFPDAKALHHSLGPVRPIYTYPTKIIFRVETFPGNWSRNENGTREAKGHCLYWSKAYFEDKTYRINCFKIQPAWMSENKEALKSLSLPKLFIPGTHNSGSNSIKEMRKRKRSASYLDNFVLNQDQSVWNQLVYGIRFLDFRIGYYPGESDPSNRFWINHDFLRLQPLLPVLKDVVEFLRSSPDEIIILDFHRFPFGFKKPNSSDIHKELIAAIKAELGDLIIPRPTNQLDLTLEKIWNTKQRIVVSYGEEEIAWKNPWLWTGVSHKWGNKQTAEDLEKFLEKTFEDTKEPRKLWAAMAELTPTPFHFLSNKSLRSMASSVNYLLNTWFITKPYWTKKTNIIATDFFLGTNLIQTGIKENVRRGNESLKQSSVINA